MPGHAFDEAFERGNETAGATGAGVAAGGKGSGIGAVRERSGGSSNAVAVPVEPNDSAGVVDG